MKEVACSDEPHRGLSSESASQSFMLSFIWHVNTIVFLDVRSHPPTKTPTLDGCLLRAFHPEAYSDVMKTVHVCLRWGISRTVGRICLHVNSMIKIQLFFLNSSSGASCDTVCPWFVANEQQAAWCPVSQKRSAALHDRIARMFWR